MDHRNLTVCDSLLTDHGSPITDHNP